MQNSETQIYILLNSKILNKKNKNEFKTYKKLKTPIIKNYVLLADSKIMF